jgi:hypothetical protein
LTALTLEEILVEGWRQHEADPGQVHAVLAGAVDLVHCESQLQAFSRLLTHLHAEHLDDRDGAWSLLEILRARFESAPSPTYRPATASIEVLRFLDGDAAGLATLSCEERAGVLATSASALAWHKRIASALAAYDRALDEAASGLPDGSPALRALAAAGNNLAVTLEQAEARSAKDDASMIRFADAALSYWKRAGGWLEQQRGHYRCAQSRLQANRPVEAIEYATRCLQLCEQNAAPAYERFFACAVGARASRAAGQLASFERWRQDAQALYEALSMDERIACQAEFVGLLTE